MFYCSACVKSFASHQSYQRHNITKHVDINYSQTYVTPDNINSIDSKEENKFAPVPTYEYPISIKKTKIQKESNKLNPIENAYQVKPHDFPNQYDEFDPSLKAPFSMVISGMSQSGKSSLVGKLLKRRHDIIDTFGKGSIQKIMYCYSEPQYDFFNF